jgi:hypothetical protein
MTKIFGRATQEEAVSDSSGHPKEILQVGRNPLGIYHLLGPIRGFDVDFPGMNGDIAPQVAAYAAQRRDGIQGGPKLRELALASCSRMD